MTGRSYTNTFTLSTSSAAKGTRAAGTHLSYVSPKQQMFVYNGTDAAVKSLKSAEVNGEIVLNVNLALNGLSSAIATIDKATLTLPGYLQISSVNGNGNGVPMVNGSKITVENVSTSSDLRLTIKAKNWISQIWMLMVRLSSAIMALSRWMVISISVSRQM